MSRRSNGTNVFDEVQFQANSVDPEGLGVDEAPGADDVSDAGGAPDSADPSTSDEDAAADAAAKVESDDDADDREADPSRPRRRWLRRVVVALGVTIFVAALCLSGFLAWQLKQRADTAAAGQAATDTARSYVVTLTSIDTGNIDQNFTAVIDGATGEFKSMYSQSSTQLRQLLVDNKAVSKGFVVDSGIKSATTTTVEVVMFVDQSVTNSVNPEPRIDRLRLTVTMELVDNRWLASKVEIV